MKQIEELQKTIEELRNQQLAYNLHTAFHDLRKAKFNYAFHTIVKELDAFMNDNNEYTIVLGYYDNNLESFNESIILNDDSVDALMDITSTTILDRLLQYHESFIFNSNVGVTLVADNAILTIDYNGYELSYNTIKQ